MLNDTQNWGNYTTIGNTGCGSREQVRNICKGPNVAFPPPTAVISYPLTTDSDTLFIYISHIRENKQIEQLVVENKTLPTKTTIFKLKNIKFLYYVPCVHNEHYL